MYQSLALKDAARIRTSTWVSPRAEQDFQFVLNLLHWLTVQLE